MSSDVPTSQTLLAADTPLSGLLIALLCLGAVANTWNTEFQESTKTHYMGGLHRTSDRARSSGIAPRCYNRHLRLTAAFHGRCSAGCAGGASGLTRKSIKNRCMHGVSTQPLRAARIHVLTHTLSSQTSMARRGKNAHKLNMYDINTKHKQKMHRSSASRCRPNSNYIKDRREQ